MPALLVECGNARKLLMYFLALEAMRDDLQKVLFKTSINILWFVVQLCD